MSQNILSVGSVVKLKKKKKRIMIIGVCQVDKNKVCWDYSGVPYPGGLANFKEVILFNAEDIEKIHFVGYMDSEAFGFLDFANTNWSKIKDENNSLY